MSTNAQAPSAVVMIRPHNFCPNQQTEQDNHFQSATTLDQTQLAKQAYQEASNAADKLRAEGITVHQFEDKGTTTPDSVFPNNWFSTHADGQLAIYPMYAENRRLERRTDIIEWLKHQYKVKQVIDYSALEHDNIFLEGTGAMVLDHQAAIAYAVRSNRCDESAFQRFCVQFNYQPMLFDATDKHGIAVYHTNVLMCIGNDYVMAGFDMITDQTVKTKIRQGFEQAGKRIINLTEQQINQFCGNALELQGKSGRLLALSTTAYQALTEAQKQSLSQSVKLLPLDVPTIELAGGSVRCMLAGIHLTSRI